MDKHKTYHLSIKALIRNSSGQILLLKTNPNSFRDKTRTLFSWDLPGGRIESGCSLDNTLHKELQEEIGVSQTVSSDLFHACIANIEIPTYKSHIGLVIFIYKVTIPNNIEIKISNEHCNYVWADPLTSSNLLKAKYPPDFTDKIKLL